MTTKLRTLSRSWTETVIDGSDFLLTLPSDSNMDVVVATTDTVQAPTSDHGHPVGYGLRNAITRELLGPGYVWAKASGICNINLSTWSSDLAAILALGGLIGYWPTDPAYLYSDDAGVTLASVDGVVGYRANLVSGGPAAVQSTLANKPVLHKYSLSDFYWLETDDGSSALTATTGNLGSSCTVAYANANGAVFTEGVTISSTYSTTPEVGYNGDFLIFDRALTAAEKTLITRHLTRDRDFVQRELLAISGLNGYWKADPAYLYEDSAGTTPASTSGTGPVGQWLPVNASLTYGSELINDPGFDNLAGNWTIAAPATSSGGQFFGNGSTTNSQGVTSVALSTGEMYALEVVVSSYTSGSFYVRLGAISTAISLSGAGTLRVLSLGHGTGSYVSIATSAFVGTIDSISLKKVTGLVATQPTPANKPILRKTPTTGVYWSDSNTSTSALNVALSDTVLGRRNLLTYTEYFSNAAWTKFGFFAFGSGSVADAIASPVGPSFLDLVIEDTSTGVHRTFEGPAVPTVIGTPITVSTYVKQGPGTRYFGCQTNTAAAAYAHCVFDLSAKTYNANGLINSATITEVSSGIFRVSITATPTVVLANSYAIFYSTNSATASSTSVTSPGYTGDGTSGFYIGGAQLEFSSIATDYQKIVSAPAYCTLARSTPEGVTFTENTEITPSYNIAPAFGFNADVAIFNRALTATEKALITRYMQRAVPMLGSNLVTNGTFDTDTVWTKGTGWSIGSGVASKSAGTASNLTQSVGVSGNAYYAKADVIVTAGTIGAYPGSGTTQFGSTAATGTLAYTMKAAGTGIGVRGDASFAGSVDNATIKEIL